MRTIARPRSCLTFKEEDVSTRRPNVLITISDDQPYYDISGLGNTEIHTPAQERMMERGTCFERVYHGGATT